VAGATGLAGATPATRTTGVVGAAPVGVRPERTRAVVSRPVGARVVRPAPGHLRLTRRGRLVTAAATLLIAVLTLVGVVSRAGSLRESAPVPASAPAQVVVAPGETLWSIAERVAPDRDPRTVVAGIQRLNDLPTAAVRAGQTLRLRAP
jgi:LysM domain